MSDGDFAHVALPHLDAAYSLARWLLRDPAAAEDVVQEAMLRALTYFATFRGDNARAWLLQIVRNTAYARIAQRRDAREEPLDAEGAHEFLADPGRDPEAALAGQEGESALARALATLPAELRECVVLRELEEMSYRDIARVTGVPAGTVMSRLFRARRMLLQYGRDTAAKERAA
jgi:RNA polymerase sigma-70 factor, ECF subfamily